MKRYGATIVFPEHFTRELAEQTIKLLVTQNAIDLGKYGTPKSTVQEFDPKYGGPVWYVP